MPSFRQRFESLPGESLGVLLYRYFFFEWLFRDVNRGSLLERAEAWRFNRHMRRNLPIYLRRWVVLVVFSYVLGALFEKGLGLDYAATFFYCVSCLAFAMSILIIRSWLGLRYG
ncbi:MAG TPA: hypothetical protein VMH26_07715 [Burkholderiales bacterium]|nr:hypothetical protein [Burkholderiales bacterium]